MTDVQAVPPPADAITGMIETRYSGQPTQRDLDVANIAAAAERERIREALLERQAVLAYVASGRHVVAVLVKDIEDVLDGGTDGQ